MEEKDNDGLAQEQPTGTPPSSCCAKYFHFGGVVEAQGASKLYIGRGAVTISNIVLATALIDLASDAAGCISNSEDDNSCDNKVYGFTPASLISNIAVLSGLLSAFFMPIVGAIVDFTPYRRATGIGAALMIGAIQAFQIGTTAKTWFAMSMLQAFAGFMMQVHIVATFAYLPDISRAVGQDTMTTYSSKLYLMLFASEICFIVLVGSLGIFIGWGDVTNAQVSQAINVLWITIFFYLGWKRLPSTPARHKLPKGRSILTEGFRQNWKTVKSINKEFKGGIRWFLLATVFAEAAAGAITSVSIIYLNDSLNMTGNEIYIFFFITLLSTVPGTTIAAFVTKRTNPKVSWQLCMMTMFICLLIGALALPELNSNVFTYVWGAFVGLILGWFYPTAVLFLSLCVPKDIEAEIAGFYVYSTQVLAWLPPLAFTVLVENDIEQKWGLIAVSAFFPVAVCILCLAAPWETIMEEAQCTSHIIPAEDEAGEEDNDEEKDALKD